ncbi:hypothetical protein [Devosia sp.]|uniref:hypothetical protein n=1 Tax=Devosia sp. TaxID=1871048 RepID=UPI0026244F64|nr:hypothetical protein [Devosia sp.]
MLELVHKAVTKDVWLNVVKTATQQAERGDKDARNWLTPWILGAPPKAPEEGADTSMVAKPDL